MIKRDLNKAGVSHVEAIISFAIFFGFLIFAFLFFSPFTGNRTLDSTLDYAFREVSDYTKMELKIYSVVIRNDADPVGVQIDNGILNPNVSVENSAGNIIGSYVSPGTNIVYFNKPADNFARIKYGADFNKGTFMSGQLLADGEFEISSSEEKKIYSEKRFMNLSNYYSVNYAELKNNFNLPNRVDFDFSLEFKDGSKIQSTIEIPENLEIKSKSERIEVARFANGANGRIEFADLTIRTW